MPEQSTLWPEGSHARTIQARDYVAALRVIAARSGGKCSDWWNAFSQLGLSVKTYRDSSAVAAVETSPSLSTPSPDAGMAWRGGYLTLNTSAFRSGGGAYSSSLDTVIDRHPPPGHWVSARSALGLLRRASRRGLMNMPEELAEALLMMTDTVPSAEDMTITSDVASPPPIL